MVKFDFITRKEYVGSYSVHKEHYWKRKLNDKIFNLGLFNSPKNLLDKKLLFKDNIDNINLELSSFCNRSCNYCPVSVYKRNYQKYFNNNLLNVILSDLSSINYDRSISLNLYNEPLANKTFFVKKMALIKKFLPKTILQTSSNGDYVRNKDFLHELGKNGLNKLKITLHPPKNKTWEHKMMKNYLERYLKRLDLYSDSNFPDDLHCYIKIGKLFLTIQCPDWANNGNNRGETVSVKKKVFNRTKPCVKPFREFTIFEDGSVTQCCEAFYDKTYKENSIGKINKKNSIFDLYSSKVLSRIRLELFGWSVKSGICSSCVIDDLSVENDKIKRKEIVKRIQS